MTRDRWIGVVLLLALVGLVAVGLWKTAGGRGAGQVPVVYRPEGLMGTDATLVVVTPLTRWGTAEGALKKAETVMRATEARMSTWLTDSELGQLNSAAAGQHVLLSSESLQVLNRAREATWETDGAFDVTCRPLVELWRKAEKRDVLPSEAEIAEARAASNWELFELDESGATKRLASARLDLGGIAKGYAVDRAAQLLRSEGFDGGMVEIGGDLLCFGHPVDGELWDVQVQDPFVRGTFATLRIPEGAVCTSGNYTRFLRIAGEYHSHIVDPRTGRPADDVPSVTVLGPTATTADIWATALSVLGPEGLDRLPSGVDALMITGTKDKHRVLCTPGLVQYIAEPLPADLVVWGASGE